MPQLTEQPYSNQFNDIIGEPPGWIIRGGVLAVLLVWLVVFLISIALPVPEAAQSAIRIIPDTQAGLIINQEDSVRISLARISNHVRVKKGEDLFVLEGKNRRVIRSPKDGWVLFEQYNSPDSYLKKGDTIATIINPPAYYYGYTQIGADQGKSICKGDNVNISLFGYPPMEYGYIKGTVYEVLLKESGRVCYVQVRIPGSLVTTFHKNIPFNTVMTGQSNFIFKGKSIFQHLTQ
ncbi:MAG: hypothetical protein JWR38_2289 [Mucilaginibacter sp.]|nr:hypothetical protein [Mucilaginibacter sp.]